MKPTDVVVVGSGMSGMIAALAVAQRGKTVNLVSRGAGALAISGGCVDVLGYVDGKPVQGNPLDSISSLAEDHPYRLMGVDAVQDALRFFEELCHAHGLPMGNAGQENVWIPTILGTFKPSYLCPAPLDRSILAQADKVVVAGVRGLKDCHAGMVIQVLQKQKRLANKPLVPLEMVSPFGITHRNLTPLDMARHVDTPEGEAWLLNQLAPHAAKGVAFLLPPILGITHTQAVWQRLSAALGCPLVEMATSPPGVGGLRIRRVLVEALAKAGVVIAENTRVAGARVEGNRCVCLICDAPDRKRELVADSFIIATGGFLGGGHVATPGKAREIIFDQDLGAPAEVTDWSVPNIFDPQPYARLGVRVNSRLNPVSDAGSVLWENVFFAGRSLAGYDFVTEKSGNGVALSTGYHAAQQC